MQVLALSNTGIVPAVDRLERLGGFFATGGHAEQDPPGQCRGGQVLPSV
jgi:hypothetical protein